MGIDFKDLEVINPEGMKVTYIPSKAPKNMESTNSLCPEVLAACLARYSRSNQGIDTIIEKFGDKDPEAIFRFVDYGHASIAGLTGALAIAIDGISMILALKLFEFSQMADGQESSTRYIAMENSPSSYLSAKEAGIQDEHTKLYNKCIALSFYLYKKSVDGLEEKVQNNPDLAKIPKDAPEKVAQRILKNYALDRARYFLPASCKTNMALVMSARMWADLLKMLDSIPWSEAKALVPLLRNELTKAAPNLVRHSFADSASLAQSGLLSTMWEEATKSKILETLQNDLSSPSIDQPLVQVWVPQSPKWEVIDKKTELKNCFEGKINRYSCVGPWVKRISVCCQWPAMALAEIRDLNRHRTGFRMTHFIPQGFYLPEETLDVLKETGQEDSLIKFFENYKNLISKLSSNTNYPYAFFLGTQLPFEHTQQGDKFIYEVELRTGMGAHFKYAQHLSDAAHQFIDEIPEIEPYINIGTAEPE